MNATIDTPVNEVLRSFPLKAFGPSRGSGALALGFVYMYAPPARARIRTTTAPMSAGTETGAAGFAAAAGAAAALVGVFAALAGVFDEEEASPAAASASSLRSASARSAALPALALPFFFAEAAGL